MWDEVVLVDEAGLELLRLGFYATAIAAVFLLVAALILMIRGFTERIGAVGVERFTCVITMFCIWNVASSSGVRFSSTRDQTTPSKACYIARLFGHDLDKIFATLNGETLTAALPHGWWEPSRKSVSLRRVCSF